MRRARPGVVRQVRLGQSRRSPLCLLITSPRQGRRSACPRRSRRRRALGVFAALRDLCWVSAAIGSTSGRRSSRRSLSRAKPQRGLRVGRRSPRRRVSLRAVRPPPTRLGPGPLAVRPPPTRLGPGPLAVRPRTRRPAPRRAGAAARVGEAGGRGGDGAVVTARRGRASPGHHGLLVWYYRAPRQPAGPWRALRGLTSPRGCDTPFRR